MGNILEVYSGQGFQRFSFKSLSSLDDKRFGRSIPPSGTSAVSWDGETNLLPFGVSVGLLIASLTFFLNTHRDPKGY